MVALAVPLLLGLLGRKLHGIWESVQVTALLILMILDKGWRIASQTTKVMSSIDLRAGYPLAANGGGEIWQCYGDALFLVQAVGVPLFMGVFLSRSI